MNVRSLIRDQEAKALLGVEPFDFARGHAVPPARSIRVVGPHSGQTGVCVQSDRYRAPPALGRRIIVEGDVDRLEALMSSRHRIPGVGAPVGVGGLDASRTTR